MVSSDLVDQFVADSLASWRGAYFDQIVLVCFNILFLFLRFTYRRDPRHMPASVMEFYDGGPPSQYVTPNGIRVVRHQT